MSKLSYDKLNGSGIEGESKEPEIVSIEDYGEECFEECDLCGLQVNTEFMEMKDHVNSSLCLSHQNRLEMKECKWVEIGSSGFRGIDPEEVIESEKVDRDIEVKEVPVSVSVGSGNIMEVKKKKFVRNEDYHFLYRNSSLSYRNRTLGTRKRIRDEERGMDIRVLKSTTVNEELIVGRTYIDYARNRKFNIHSQVDNVRTGDLLVTNDEEVAGHIVRDEENMTDREKALIVEGKMSES